MKNVYDILVNFKKNPYEFYEWEKDDNIKHIKKIMAFKIEDKVLLDFMNYDVLVDKKFMSVIKDQTEVFSGRTINKMNYACLLCNDDSVLAVDLNDEGLVIGKSKLLFDEADDIIKKSNDMSIYDLEYNIVSKNKHNKLLTRKENKEVFLVLKYLNKIYDSKNVDEINYLHYECFDIKEEDYLKSYMLLKKQIEEGNFFVINKIKSFIKVAKR